MEVAAEPAVPGQAAETAPRGEETAPKVEITHKAEVARKAERKAEITPMVAILMMETTTTRMAEAGILQPVAEIARKAERAGLELAAETRGEPADSPIGVEVLAATSGGLAR